MKDNFKAVIEHLKSEEKTWLVTGCAGFIGSNLVEALLKLNQKVVGLDNFATGYRRNLDEVKDLVSSSQWSRFVFVEGDICDLETCNQVCKGVDYVLHQAALGSVPRSIKDPIATNKANIVGFLNMLIAARDAGVKSFTYAASSSTYGDHTGLPKVEDIIGKPLSPYAITKYVNELYAEIFARSYGFQCIGLRYFNVFGKRQDPDGAYAAVIPKWVAAMIKNEDVFINGDGETSRDFCYIENVIQANILSSVASTEAKNQIYNIAVGDKTTLNELANYLRNSLKSNGVNYDKKLVYRDFRAGDVKHSQASVEKAEKLLGYKPVYKLIDGLSVAMDWYVKRLRV